MSDNHTSFIKGERYRVSCAEIRLVCDGQIHFVPVFDHLHADPQFGFPHKHYHIDGRFYLHPNIQHTFQVNNGHTAMVITPGKSSTYEFLAIGFHDLLCVETTTGLVIPTHPTKQQKPKLDQYKAWYQNFIGQKCEGRKCPHFGTEMLERSGQLVCPMHHLTADLQTQIIVKRQLVKPNIEISGNL